MTEDLTQLSASQLRERTAAVERELQRRSAQDQAQQAEAFAQEVAEVKAGKRRCDDEHVPYLSPDEMVEVINRGQLVHKKINPDRRLRRGQ